MIKGISCKSVDFGAELDKYQDVNPRDSKENGKVPKFFGDEGDSEKNAALIEVLVSLSSLDPKNALDDDKIDEYCEFFEGLYSDGSGFRHMYSSVCNVMFGFFSTEGRELDDGVPFQAIYLSNSMNIIYPRIVSKAGKESRPARCSAKLCDHIDLECTRMRYMAHQNSEVLRRAGDLSERIQETEGLVSGFEQRVEEAQEKTQRNHVTTLGIFASVVIAFMSGATFSSAVLQSMNEASIYRLCFIMLVLGFFLSNLLFAMFMFLAKIAGVWKDAGINVAKHVVVVVDALIVLSIITLILTRPLDPLGGF